MSRPTVRAMGLAVLVLAALALPLGVTPVSYTHLDVYKRQHCVRCPPEGAVSAFGTAGRH